MTGFVDKLLLHFLAPAPFLFILSCYLVMPSRALVLRVFDRLSCSDQFSHERPIEFSQTSFDWLSHSEMVYRSTRHNQYSLPNMQLHLEKPMNAEAAEDP
jgi:hypothetical protein